MSPADPSLADPSPADPSLVDPSIGHPWAPSPPAGGTFPVGAAVHRRFGFGRLVRSEIRLVFGRRRNQVLLVALGCVPLLIGTAVKMSGADNGGGGPAFLNQITSNGLFLVFTALVVSLPLFLPLAVGIVSGDALSGEANLGTLRYLLTVPVSRSRLLLAKWLGSASFTLAAVGTVVLVGLGAGIALFPIGRVTLLSGSTVPLADGLLRGLGVGLLVAVSLLGLVTIGLFISTLTEVPVAAMASTVVLAVISAVLDSLPQVKAVHPYLLTHHWYDFDQLLRLAPDASLLLTGIAVQLGYIGVFGALAWSRFTTADISA
jgi:ABC-2 type transport system permease protein